MSERNEHKIVVVAPKGYFDGMENPNYSVYVDYHFRENLTLADIPKTTYDLKFDKKDSNGNMVAIISFETNNSGLLIFDLTPRIIFFNGTVEDSKRYESKKFTFLDDRYFAFKFPGTDKDAVKHGFQNCKIDLCKNHNITLREYREEKKD